MKYSIETVGDQVTVTLAGEITAQSVKDLKNEVAEAVRKWPDREWVLKCDDLLYISSAGLRWLLLLKKQISKEIRIIGVQRPVMDIFELTVIVTNRL